MPPSSLWERIWIDLSAAIGPVGLLLSALGWGVAYLFWRNLVSVQKRKDQQSEWISGVLIRVIERNTASTALVASQVKEVAKSLPPSSPNSADC